MGKRSFQAPFLDNEMPLSQTLNRNEQSSSGPMPQYILPNSLVILKKESWNRKILVQNDWCLVLKTFSKTSKVGREYVQLVQYVQADSKVWKHKWFWRKSRSLIRQQALSTFIKAGRTWNRYLKGTVLEQDSFDFSSTLAAKVSTRRMEFIWYFTSKNQLTHKW